MYGKDEYVYIVLDEMKCTWNKITWINIFPHFLMVFFLFNLTCIKTSQSYHILSELWLVDFWWSLYGLTSLAKCVFEKFLSEY